MYMGGARSSEEVCEEVCDAYAGWKEVAFI